MKHKDWVKIFRALGNERRLHILQLLSQEKELPVYEIAERIKLSRKSTSKHLRLLMHLNFLDRGQKKGEVYYAFNTDMPAKIKQILQGVL
ncbi:MAG: ArsR/SmtB family transcription factor [Candidatus Paceibacteria bacterium]